MRSTNTSCNTEFNRYYIIIIIRFYQGNTQYVEISHYCWNSNYNHIGFRQKNAESKCKSFNKFILVICLKSIKGVWEIRLNEYWKKILTFYLVTSGIPCLPSSNLGTTNPNTSPSKQVRKELTVTLVLLMHCRNHQINWLNKKELLLVKTPSQIYILDRKMHVRKSIIKSIGVATADSAP